MKEFPDTFLEMMIVPHHQIHHRKSTSAVFMERTSRFADQPKLTHRKRYGEQGGSDGQPNKQPRFPTRPRLSIRLGQQFHLRGHSRSIAPRSEQSSSLPLWPLRRADLRYLIYLSTQAQSSQVPTNFNTHLDFLLLLCFELSFCQNSLFYFLCFYQTVGCIGLNRL